jgi:hypothetical protein|tara:strand:- start:64 stop:765 length:702 start_codon:yes stop_codon:yes gene_type:complete
MNIYYVYQYVREDQTPYYIGKGKDDRAWVSHCRSNGAEIKPKDNSRIQILKENLTEQEAFALETELIQKYELKENGGLLVNMTYGGEGRTPGKELREDLSKKLTGKKKPPRTEEHIRNHKLAAERRRGTSNPKTAQGLKEWYATNPDRSETIAKQSASLKEWYKTADKETKAWNTWHTRYKQDYNEYARAIMLLKELSISEVEKKVKFQRDTLRKLKNQAHGVYKHFPELLQS